jgi:hypothetical protein
LKRTAVALLRLARTVGPSRSDELACPHCGEAVLCEPATEQYETLQTWDVGEIAAATGDLCRGHFNMFSNARRRLMWCPGCERLVTWGKFAPEWSAILAGGKTRPGDAPEGLLVNLRDLKLLEVALHEAMAPASRPVCGLKELLPPPSEGPQPLPRRGHSDEREWIPDRVGEGDGPEVEAEEEGGQAPHQLVSPAGLGCPARPLPERLPDGTRMERSAAYGWSGMIAADGGDRGRLP